MASTKGDSATVVVRDSGQNENKRVYGTVESDGESTNSHNPFLDTDLAQRWKDVYENAQYECRHYFDPGLTWSADEERRLVRKIDWRICLWAVCCPILQTEIRIGINMPP